MDITSIQEYLGYSIHHPEVQELIKQLSLDELILPDTEGGLDSLFGQSSGRSFWHDEYRNEELGVYLYFKKKRIFLLSYKHLRYEAHPEDEDELILTYINFRPKDKSLRLAFGLQFQDSQENIIKTLGNPSYEFEFQGQMKSSYRKDDYRIKLSLNEDHRLAGMNVSLIGLQLYWAEERERNLPEFDSSIHAISEEEKTELRKLNPASRWKDYNDEWLDGLGENLEENDLQFRRKALTFFDLLDALFEEYLSLISKYAEEKNPRMLYETLKASIRKFNEWKDEHQYIMTMEREGLCYFLEEILKATGFHIHENEHVTDNWRDW